jgi:ankyrin repeat protein
MSVIEQNNLINGKLKKSLTYLLAHGYFNRVCFILKTASLNDLNEKDTWWLDLKSNSTTRPKTSLPDGGQTDSKGVRGRTPLMLCSLLTSNEWAWRLTQDLLERGAFISCKDSNGHNALMYACLYERLPLLQLFSNAPGDYDILAVDKYGNTALHLASLSRSQAICTILHRLCQKFKINCFNVKKNAFGHTPYDLCKMNGHLFCINTLYSNENNQIILKSLAGNQILLTFFSFLIFNLQSNLRK